MCALLLDDLCAFFCCHCLMYGKTKPHESNQFYAWDWDFVMYYILCRFFITMFAQIGGCGEVVNSHFPSLHTLCVACHVLPWTLVGGLWRIPIS